MEYCTSTHKTQEMVAEVFSSFDHSTLSSAEQAQAKVCKCRALLGEMLLSFDRGFSSWVVAFYKSLAAIMILRGCPPSRGLVLVLNLIFL